MTRSKFWKKSAQDSSRREMLENNAVRGIGPGSTWGFLERLHFRFSGTRGGQWLELAWALTVGFGFLAVACLALIVLARALGAR